MSLVFAAPCEADIAVSERHDVNASAIVLDLIAAYALLKRSTHNAQRSTHNS
jgi:hypothetical protein